MEKKALQRKKPSRKHWKKTTLIKKLWKNRRKNFFLKKKLWEKNILIDKKTSTPSQKKQPLWEKKSLKKKKTNSFGK